MIKKLLLTAAVLAACTGAAQASTYDFTYTFGNDQGVMTGSVDGTLVGDTLTNVSNIQVSFDGVAYSGTLSAGAYNGTNYTYTPGAAVISTDAAKNNFIFADNTDANANNVQNFFYFFNGTTPGGNPQEVLAANVVTGQLGIDSPGGAWSLKPVPVPAALPLLMSGLGMLAAAKRRRQNQAAA